VPTHSDHAAEDRLQVRRRGGRKRAFGTGPTFSIAAYVDSGFAWKRAEDEARLRNALARAGLPE
jgi:hypothetical protein